MYASAAEVEASGTSTVLGWDASFNLLLLSGMVHLSVAC